MKKKPRIHFDDFINHQRSIMNIDYTLKEWFLFWEKTLGIKTEDGMNVRGMSEEIIEKVGVDLSIAHTLMQNCYSFVGSGCQVFDMGQVVCEQYLNTSLDGVTSADFVMPYDCFYMALPPGLLQCWNWETGYHDTWGIYVRKPNYQERKLVDISITVQAGPNNKSVSFSDDAMHWCGLKFKDIDEKGVEDFIFDLLGTAVGWQIPDSANVDEIFRKVKQAELQATLQKAARLVVNLMCDLDQHGTDIREDSIQKGRRKKRLNIEEGLEHYAPGRKRKELNKVTKISISNLWRVGEKLESEFKRRNPKEGFWVKGHRQVYWIGHGRAIRKLKYKRPRWQQGEDGKQPDLNSGNTYEIVE